MDSRIPSPNPQIVAVTTTARPTPTPVRVKFSEVLARGAGTFVSGAEAAMTKLPGSSLMAVAVRGGTVPVSMTPMSRGGSFGGAGGAAEGPGGSTVSAGGVLGATAANAAGFAVPGAGFASAGGVPGASGGDGGIESSLAQSQEMNLYYLQIQEQVNAENRTYSALSNVLKAEHETVKTAIGNIR